MTFSFLYRGYLEGVKKVNGLRPLFINKERERYLNEKVLVYMRENNLCEEH